MIHGAPAREPLIGLQGKLQADPDSQEPGRRAQAQLIAGRYDRIDPLVAQVLAGLAVRLAVLRNAETPDPELIQRARAVDPALPWVACDLGLDCSANSIGVLQPCAARGTCDGDLLVRLANQAVAASCSPTGGLPPAQIGPSRLARSGVDSMPATVCQRSAVSFARPKAAGRGPDGRR